MIVNKNVGLLFCFALLLTMSGLNAGIPSVKFTARPFFPSEEEWCGYLAHRFNLSGLRWTGVIDEFECAVFTDNVGTLAICDYPRSIKNPDRLSGSIRPSLNCKLFDVETGMRIDGASMVDAEFRSLSDVIEVAFQHSSTNGGELPSNSDNRIYQHGLAYKLRPNINTVRIVFPKDNGGKSTECIVNLRDTKNNDDHRSGYLEGLNVNGIGLALGLIAAAIVCYFLLKRSPTET